MIKETKGDRIFNIINYIFMTLGLIIVAWPLIYVISASMSDPVFVNSGEMWLFPKGLTFEGYKRVINNPDIWIGYRNTIFYTIAGTCISLFITIPCAYALAKKDLPGRGFFSGMLLVTMFFNGGLIPLYMLIKNLGILYSRLSILLIGAASVWNIIITKTFIQTSIPIELEEAMEIDGCNVFNKFFRIIIPLSAPIIAVMSLFYGVGRWNSYFNEMIFLKDSNKYPLQVFLREILIITQMNAGENLSSQEVKTMAEMSKLADMVKYSVMIVSTLPLIMIYPFLQKYFVKGIMIGSLKG